MCNISLINLVAYPGILNGGEGGGLWRGSEVGDLPPEVRRSENIALSAGRFLQFFNKSNELLCIFRPKRLF